MTATRPKAYADSVSSRVAALLLEAAERLEGFAVGHKRGVQPPICSICWHRDFDGNLLPGHTEYCIIPNLRLAAKNGLKP